MATTKESRFNTVPCPACDGTGIRIVWAGQPHLSASYYGGKCRGCNGTKRVSVVRDGKMAACGEKE